jgi:hypothetical protein
MAPMELVDMDYAAAASTTAPKPTFLPSVPQPGTRTTRKADQKTGVTPPAKRIPYREQTGRRRNICHRVDEILKGNTHESYRFEEAKTKMNDHLKSHILAYDEEGDMTTNPVRPENPKTMVEVMVEMLEYNKSTDRVVARLFESIATMADLVNDIMDDQDATEKTIDTCLTTVSQVEGNILEIENSKSISNQEHSKKKALELIKKSGLETLVYGIDFKKVITNRDEIKKVGKQVILDSAPADRKAEIKKILDLKTTKVHPLGKETRLDENREIYTVPFVIQYENTDQKFPCDRIINSVQNLSTAIVWPKEIKKQIEQVKIYAKNNYPNMHHRIKPSYRSGNIEIHTRSANSMDKDRTFKLAKEFTSPILDSDVPVYREGNFNPYNLRTEKIVVNRRTPESTL